MEAPPAPSSSLSALRHRLRSTVCCCFGSGGGGLGERMRWRRRAGVGEFRYDPLSYALNFDEGHGASLEGDFTGYRDFSARFVGPPASAKSSMDLGGRDAPPLFNPPPQPPHDGAGWA